MILPRSLRCLPALREDARGSAVIEFAVAAPVLLVLLIGIYDMGHTAYLKAVLSGALETASRSDGIEASDNARADSYVRSIISRIAPDATVTFKRMSYYDFADLKRAEKWTDRNANGKCDNGEPYTDENRSGKWEADVGSASNGGANDVVMYTATVSYKPVFVVPFIDGAGNQRTLVASSVRKNQPYALQARYGSAAGNCS